MPANHIQLIAACLAMVMLVFAVGIAMFSSRIQEIRRKRINSQEIATSAKMAVHFENVQAADNYRNLFEMPVLFFALAAIALGINYVPGWLVVCSWIYVALRLIHSVIHCTYNKVSHRFVIFLISSGLLLGMWVVYFVSLASKTPCNL